MRRLHRGRGGSSKNRRSVKWGGTQFYGNAVSMQDRFITEPPEVATFWARWPSDIPDPLNADNIPEEDTWIKCHNYFSVSTSTGGPQVNDAQFVALGLIAWDSIDPIILDNALTQGNAPSPFDGNWDWIWRSVFCGNFLNEIDGQLVDFAGGTSRAMRKLPPATGVLMCISQANQANQTQEISWAWDVRFAVKVEK